MRKKAAVWQLINDRMENGIPVMLLYVLESRGSSPGRQGFLMAVTAQGEMQGSIGGGMMEHKLVELAKEKLKTKSEKEHRGKLIRQIHDKSASHDQSGMICSGEQTVFLYPVQEKDKAAIQEILSCLQNFQTGTLLISAQGIAFHSTISTNFFFHYTNAEDWLYEEKVGYQQHLYIVGGGHCALALSKLMSSLDFYIHLFDDREDLFTMEQNDSVHQKMVVTDYSQLSSLIPSGDATYVVIMTFGYRTDDLAVRALLGKEFRYIGLLGSKTKIRKMFDTYREEGMEKSWLEKIYAPVGLPIKSETPEEIAISIAAQIIREKNLQK